MSFGQLNISYNLQTNQSTKLKIQIYIQQYLNEQTYKLNVTKFKKLFNVRENNNRTK